MTLTITADASVQVRICTAFSDPGLGPGLWRRVASRAGSWTVFREWDWQHVWWESFGRGEMHSWPGGDCAEVFAGMKQ